MALTRKLLKSFNLEDSVIDSIIEAHAETVDGLKAERDEAKKAAESTRAVTKERDDLKNQLEVLQKAGGDAAKIQKEFDDYKAGIEAEKATAKKRGAMLDLLKNKVGVARESARKLIVDAMDLSIYELANDTQFKDEDNIVTDLKGTHAEWIGEVKTDGVPSLNPPSGVSGNGTGKTREEIMAIKDTARRQMEIFNNRHLFPEHFKD